MNLTLYIWRQKGPDKPGRLEEYSALDISPDMSFLEMRNVLNDDLIKKDIDHIYFDPYCRVGISDTCSLANNGCLHGPH